MEQGAMLKPIHLLAAPAAERLSHQRIVIEVNRSMDAAPSESGACDGHPI
jgi:hypothetical protein